LRKVVNDVTIVGNQNRVAWSINLKILNIYKWATVGGVERVILNRACAFKKHGVNVRQDVYFLHDSGGLKYFRKFIEICGLEQWVHIVTKINEKVYDRIFIFDTPEVFDFVSDRSKVVIECHSPYKESRAYLKSLPGEMKCIASPSQIFLESVVRREVSSDFHDRLHVLPNFHMNDFSETMAENDIGGQGKIWGKKPICYIGRIDSMKNTKELFDVLAQLRKTVGDEYFLLLVGDVRPHYMDLRETLRKYQIDDRVAYFRPIPYEKVDVLLSAVRHNSGIFVSPSQGESFGLSALEAMCNGVPVLLSDIDCHKSLVSDERSFIYSLGNVSQAVQEIGNISKDYEALSVRAEQLAQKHTSAAFIEAWGRLFI